MNYQRRVRKLEAIHARLPSMNCIGKCAPACGPIAMSRTELERIENHLGYRPGFISSSGEAFAILQATGNPQDLTCPMLDNGKCSIYELRPTICRTWGMTADLACPHGCKPEFPLSDDDAGDMLREVRDL